MGLKSLYENDRPNDRVLPPINIVQVLMIRGLFKKWKHPVFYGYKYPTRTFLDTIRRLYAIGITVVGIVTDMGVSNGKAYQI